MRIGVPREIKVHEYRVGLTPGSVEDLVRSGHDVAVESRAGAGIGFTDEKYRAAGAQVLPDAASVYAGSELIVKVKEPQPSEYRFLRGEHILFTYLHLAADAQQARALVTAGTTAIAYETVTADGGGLPLLAPMSEVAGRMSVQVGAKCLEKESGGIGKLLGGVPGVAPAKVVILGGGMAGTNAALIAVGMQADVTVLEKSVARMRVLADRFGSSLRLVMANPETIRDHVMKADLVIGAVLVAGAAAPKLVSRDMVRAMREGSVIVDISIDQGGCIETSRPTTHSQPTYVDEGVVHYCVTNMPGAVAHTSALALNNATLPFVHALADEGLEALARDPHLAAGLNVHRGAITHAAVAEALGLPFVPFRAAA
jgi:alanine dehydrogenase